MTELLVDIFSETRRLVTARQAAEFYGLEINRAGRARCCFHSPDKHPSMTLKGNGFHCWSCGAHGSSIDLVAQLYGLDGLGAVRKMNEDFRLGLPLDRQQTPAERREAAQAARRRREVAEAHGAFEEWRTTFIAKLNTAYRVGHQALNRLGRPEDFSGLSERECIAVQLMPHIEDVADTLSSGPPEEQAKIYRGRRRTEKWIEALLKNS